VPAGGETSLAGKTGGAAGTTSAMVFLIQPSAFTMHPSLGVRVKEANLGARFGECSPRANNACVALTSTPGRI